LTLAPLVIVNPLYSPAVVVLWTDSDSLMFQCVGHVRLKVVTKCHAVQTRCWLGCHNVTRLLARPRFTVIDGLALRRRWVTVEELAAKGHNSGYDHVGLCAVVFTLPGHLASFWQLWSDWSVDRCWCLSLYGCLFMTSYAMCMYIISGTETRRGAFMAASRCRSVRREFSVVVCRDRQRQRERESSQFSLRAGWRSLCVVYNVFALRNEYWEVNTT